MASDASTRSRRSEFDRAMAAWSARAWRVARRSAGIEPGWRVADGEGADDVAAGRAERRGGHRAEAHAVGDVEVVWLPGDARVGRVARRPDDAALARREAVDPAVDRELLDPQPVARLLVRAAREHHRAQVRPVLGHPGQVGAVRAEDAPRLLDDQPEDRVGVADGRDARRDLAQRPLGLGAPGDLLARPAELADQLRVVDGDRREIRERREQRGLLVAEAPDVRREHRERAQHHGLADERREGDRPDAGTLEELAVRARRRGTGRRRRTRR